MAVVRVVSYSIYHSANSYIGVILAQRALAGLEVQIERRPLCIPKARGHMVAHLAGGAEGAARSSYNREDCTRWAARHAIPLNLVAPEVFTARAAKWQQSPLGREELAARAYYAALGSSREGALDAAFFRASYVDSLDVNDDDVVRSLATESGLEADSLLARARGIEAGERLAHALAEFERDGCPGVPTWVVAGERFWGKDRVDWLAERVWQLTR